MADNTNGRSFANTDGDTLDSLVSGISDYVKNQQKSLKELNDIVKGFNKEQKTQYTKYEKLGDAVVGNLATTAKQVIQWGINLFKTSFNAVQQSYLSNFSEITAKMNIAASEYTKIYQETAKDLRTNGLDVHFDTSDFSNMLKQELAEGFRGEIAQRKAMIDLISKKLIPSIDTSSRSYVLGYRKLGDDFAKMTTGLYKLNTTLGKNMEYFESSMYSTTQEMFLNTYLASGADMNGYYQMQQLLADMTTSFGQDVVNNFLSQLNQSANGVTATLPMILAGYASGSSVANAMGSAEGVQELFNNWLSTQAGFASGANNDRTVLNAYAQSGIITSAVDAMMIDRYKDSYDLQKTQVTTMELIAQYQQGLKELQEGRYTSETEKFDKMINNTQLVVDSATWIAEKIPTQIQQLIGIIAGGITAIVGAILTQNGSVSMSQLLTGKGGWGAIGSGAMTSTSAGIVGGLSLSGGIIWSAIDAANSAVNIAKSGKGNAVVGGLEKLLLGSDWSGRDIDYQIANTDIDWTDVLTSGGKGALIGGGIGAMAEGAGAVPGAIIGAIGGAVTNLVTQVIEKAQLKKYLELQEKLNDSTSQLYTSQSDYNRVLEKSKDINKLLNIIDDESLNNEEERNAALRVLQEQFPTLIGNLSDVNEWSSDYSDIIQATVTAERELAKYKYEGSLAGLEEAAAKYASEGVIKGTYSEEMVRDFLDLFGKVPGYENAIDTGSQAFKDYIEKYNIAADEGMLGFGVGAYTNFLSNMETSLGLGGPFNAGLTLKGSKISLGTDITEGLKSSYSDLYKSGVNLQDKNKFLSEDLPGLINDVSGLVSILNNLDDMNEAQKYIEYYTSIAKSFEIIRKQRGYGTTPITSESAAFKPYVDSINKIIGEKGWDIPLMAFATGADYIGEDNTLAMLHRGEIVLNANDADSYRKLVGTMTIQSYANGASNSKIEVIPMSLMTNIDSTITKISIDISTIVTLLGNIQDKVGATPRYTGTSAYPDDTRNIRNFSSPYLTL